MSLLGVTQRTSIRKSGESARPLRLLHAGSTLALLFVVSSCAIASDEAACANGFVRDGTTYYPHEAPEPPPPGRSLGRVPVITCDEGAGDGESGPEYGEAVAIRGVDPADAFLVPDQGPSTIYAPGPPDGSEMSAEVEKLLADDRG